MMPRTAAELKARRDDIEFIVGQILERERADRLPEADYLRGYRAALLWIMGEDEGNAGAIDDLARLYRNWARGE